MILYGENGSSASSKKQTFKLGQPLQELSSNEDESHKVDEVMDQTSWLKEFTLYLNATTSCPAGMTIIQWWGVSDFVSE